ncbi:MAG: ABC transporter ATP-binding protein/permease [Burkholderiaceae bacterium]|nr:ABC transporter ATP-binding protein/permease [Burkholderiaceae bacterium]
MFGFFERRLPPYPDAQPALPPKDFMAFVWHVTQGMRGPVLLMAALSVVRSVFDAFLFAAMGYVIDWLAQTQPQRLWATHGHALALLLGVLAASIALVALHTTIKHQSLAINFPMRLRWNFHRLMLGQSLAFYADEFAGRITAKIMQTALAVRDMIFTTTDVLIGMSVYMAAILALAADFDAWLLLPFLLWTVLFLCTCWYFVPRLARVSRAQADARSMMTGRVTDAYTNIATVKLFSHTNREAAFARAAMDELKTTGYAQMRLISQFEIVNHTLIVLLISSACGMALWLWSGEKTGAGAVAAVTAMALRMSGMSHWVMWEMSNLFESVGTVQDGINTLTRARSVVDAPDAKSLQVARGQVTLENVSFSYRGDGGGGAPVIDQLSLDIQPGEKIGLIGRSGAGKSTLVNLLLRFYDVQSGRILIDGQDIAHVTQDSLRQAIGMVTQDTSLLHRSIADNIRYGLPGATDAQMLSAARRAQAHDFIERLSDPQGRQGYAAQAGERGVKLSGGQRQRVAIARVMLNNAPILLLDEATSALDSEVEAAIQDSLHALMEGKTVIAIAHRLSTIAALDRLVVLDKGRIVEQGNHAELLARGGLYARLWARQSGGFLGEQAEGEP